MMKHLVCVLFFFFLNGLFAKENDCPLPCECNQTHLEPGVVEKYCKNLGASILDRCCISNNTIIGLDLRNCTLEPLNITEPIYFHLEILDLSNNKEVKLSSSALLGLLKLDFLYLPEHVTCPGGNFGWNETTPDCRHLSPDHNVTSCCYQLNPCLSMNISCGEEDNAGCHHLGPGSAKCICNPGHFGYKCLNYGKFPVAIFSTSVIIPAIILSIVLWFVQGRDAYRKGG